MHARRETAQRTVRFVGHDLHEGEESRRLLPLKTGASSSPAGGLEAVRGVLQRALHAHGMSRRLPRRIPASVWELAVGKQIAARAQPTVLTAGILHILVQDHRWRDQLDAARNFVVERINRRLGAGVVRQLQFGLAHEGALTEGRRRAGIGAVQAPAELLLEPGKVLGDARLSPSLREAVLRAAEAAQRRRA